MNYTKGEWKAEQDAANSIRIFSQDSEQISSVMDYDGNDITEEMEANAHLIAAAPDMYEALLSALGAIATEDSGEGWVKEITGVITKAMAKAEGKEEKDVLSV